MIHRFRVQNFKSIIDSAVDLSAVTVLVGKSGTGKSNFVEAIRTLRDLLSSPNDQNLIQQWPQVCPATTPGFRRFYAHLLALYQRPPKQTLLFEHPEDGIHPGALALLAEEFKAAPEDNRGQIILTTHSPKLLDHFEADQIRVVELDGFATRIGPISSEQREAIREDLLNAGELLTVDPARLESAAPESAGA